jgi:hypothetical protein
MALGPLLSRERIIGRHARVQVKGAHISETRPASVLDPLTGAGR